MKMDEYILSLLETGEYNFRDLCEATDAHPSALYLTLEMLINQGRIEHAYKSIEPGAKPHYRLPEPSEETPEDA